MVPARPFFIGRPGRVRSSAWICDFSSTLSTTACFARNSVITDGARSTKFLDPPRRARLLQRPPDRLIPLLHRQPVVSGQRVSDRVTPGGSVTITKNIHTHTTITRLLNNKKK